MRTASSCFIVCIMVGQKGLLNHGTVGRNFDGYWEEFPMVGSNGRASFQSGTPSPSKSLPINA